MNEKLKELPLFDPLTDSNPKNIIWSSVYQSGPEGTLGTYVSKRIREQNLDIFNYIEVQLSSADILALNWNTGLEIMPALAPNQYYSKLTIEANFTAGNISYVPSDGSKWLDFYHAGRDNFVSNGLITNSGEWVSIIDIPVLKIQTTGNDGNDNTTVPTVSQLSNLQSNVELYFGTLNDAELTLGNGTLLLKIYYKIETFGSNL